MKFITNLYESDYFAVILLSAIAVVSIIFIILAIKGKKKNKESQDDAPSSGETAFAEVSAPPVAVETALPESGIPAPVIPPIEQSAPEAAPQVELAPQPIPVNEPTPVESVPQNVGEVPSANLFEPITNVIDDFKPGEPQEGVVSSEPVVVTENVPSVIEPVPIQETQPEVSAPVEVAQEVSIIPVAPLSVEPTPEVSIPQSPVEPAPVELNASPVVAPEPVVEIPIIPEPSVEQTRTPVEVPVAPNNQFSSVYVDNPTIELPKIAEEAPVIAPSVPEISIPEVPVETIENANGQ